MRTDTRHELMTNDRTQIIRLAKKIIPIKAISPKSGGNGESKRADFLEKTIQGFGVKTQRYSYVDDDKFERPNIVAQVGSSKRAINIIAHIDTVAAVDLKAWKTDPFKAVVSGDKIFGRGSEDDGHGLISGILSLKAASQAAQIGNKYSFRLVLAADEEMGSEYGIVKLLGEKLFKKNDIFIVPDWGTPRGNQIEVAEKGILWLKITVHGKQTHGSTPNLGMNASRLSSELQLRIYKELNLRYALEDEMFDPKYSTFEPTKREQNVDSINIIPGKDVFYMDMRILPKYGVADILARVKKIIKESGMQAEVEVEQRNEPSMVQAKSSAAYNMLHCAIKSELHLKPIPVGIGGGTVAAYLRHSGYDAVVWGVIDDMAHASNEYVRISAVEKEIAVIKRLLTL